jgi:uncharacterized membrane protein (UPF0127 family)|tara:strand:+ start:4036 stop:4476 length:441 start_codon:yes stop_codon:yes gene_type:complete
MRLVVIVSLFLMYNLCEVSASVKSELSIITSNGSKHNFLVEVAKTEEEKKIGLMFRKTLAKNAGMLFLYKREALRLMWMKNTFIPLDILFIDKNGVIKRVVKRTIPHSLATISSRQSVLAVLELRGGITSSLEIKKGDRIEHPAFK